MIDNTQDTIDSRDVIARIEELGDPDYQRSEDEHSEYLQLIDLAEQGEQNAEYWTYGATLIRDMYFAEYARELAHDLYYDKLKELQWPLTHIDWDAAADELLIDYSELDFGGVTYYVR